MKTSYISPATGDLEIQVIRDANPYVVIELDLGIPNFTRFSLKFPLVVDEPKNMATVTQEALGVLLDEVATFMMSLSFNQAVITDIYARALSCFAGMDMNSSTQADFPASAQDHHIQTFEGKFALPTSFVEETYNRVVTGAQVVKRLPAVRKIEFAPATPANRINTNDAQRVIKMYRNRQLKSQPKPLFIIVYDQMGNATGVLPVQQQWKSKLLQRIQASAPNDPPDYAERVRKYEEEGMTTSDAQAVVDAEEEKKKKADSKPSYHNQIWLPGANNSYTADMSILQRSSDRKCPNPKCNAGRPVMWDQRDRENEITHWTGRCPECGANVTIFND